jgi:tetratricopeptide (TPR) repeat protein
LLCDDKQDYEGAIAAFRRAIELRPDSAVSHCGLGIALAHQGKLPEAEAALLQAIRLQPDYTRAYSGLGSVFAQGGQWEKAGDVFQRGLDRSPGDHTSWYQVVALRLHRGDVEGYRRACRAMLERFGQTDQPDIAAHTARTCLLLPDAVGDPDRIRKLADRAVSGTESHRSYRSFLLTRGLADYRVGKYADAVEWLKRFSPKANGGGADASAFAVLAMTYQRLGQAEAARAAIANAQALVATKMPDPDKGQPFGDDWHDWLHGQILLREAGELLGTKSR